MPPPIVSLPPIALTMGEPAGIGPDITLAAWNQRTERHLPTFALVGCLTTLRDRAAALGLDTPLVQIDAMSEATHAFSRALPILSPSILAPTGLSPAGLAPARLPALRPGHPEPATAPMTISAIETAVALVQRGEASAVVTNPIAKSVLYASGFTHPGHTEYLAELAARHWGGAAPRPVMMIASHLLRVVPLTIHLPLIQVASALSIDAIVDTVRVTHAALIADFGIAAPRIVVLGLNPHAGESGAIGHEDDSIIAPAIALLRAEGLAVTGPHPADTMFHPAARARYDVAIGMYHDQVLVPAKTLAFDTGVNVTLGLPFVRTSPDHGTAFDIAGTGRASPESLIAALKMAAAMAANRRARAGQGAA